MKVTGHSKYGAKYPKLAKKSSDGTYCYLVQRRLSSFITGFCVRRKISANTATWIDFIFAVFAALSLYLGYNIIGAVFIQLFGIWSCVDGEIARLTKTTSKLGDFYDTMVDRVAEFLIIGALFLSVRKTSPEITWVNIFFFYMGAIFLITASSEKFRSTFHKNYPKKQIEPFFSLLCAGSDIRFFYLSLGIITYDFIGYAPIIQWLIIIQTVFLGLNFIFRLWRIFRFIEEEKKIKG